MPGESLDCELGASHIPRCGNRLVILTPDAYHRTGILRTATLPGRPCGQPELVLGSHDPPNMTPGFRVRRESPQRSSSLAASMGCGFSVPAMRRHDPGSVS